MNEPDFTDEKYTAEQLNKDIITFLEAEEAIVRVMMILVGSHRKAAKNYANSVMKDFAQHLQTELDNLNKTI